MKLTYLYFVVCLIVIYSCQNIAQEDLDQPNLVFSVTDLSIGKNRLAFGIIQSGKGSLTPENVVVETYFLDGNPSQLIEKSIAVPYLWPNNKTIFVTEVNFHQSGKWGIGIKMSENMLIIQKLSVAKFFSLIHIKKKFQMVKELMLFLTLLEVTLLKQLQEQWQEKVDY